MSKRVVEFFIVDILIAIEKVKRYTSEFNCAQDFIHDEKSFDATMRELEIIGEATKHLIRGNLLDNEWQIVVDFRNVIAHEYFGIDSDEIWEVITIYLDKFRDEITKLFENGDKDILDDVIKSNLDDFKYSSKTVALLTALLEKIKA
jgi:uncharacterized protein with HEPN domain